MRTLVPSSCVSFFPSPIGRVLLILTVCLSAGLSSAWAATAAADSPFHFQGTITSATLENYLARAVQCAGLCDDASGHTSPHFPDDLRMLRNIGARFVGRAALTWHMRTDDDRHFEDARRKAARVHEALPETILQACVFEIVHTSAIAEPGGPRTGADTTTVPLWVFEEFGLPSASRTFDYQAMLSTNAKGHDLWGKGASVPDITRPETRMWFYYRARRYIDSGYEAIHFGQAGMIGMNDRDAANWADLLSRVRRYASRAARRGYVLCDAHLVMTDPHVPILHNGTLLWDFASFPLRLTETTEPLRAELRVGHRDAMYRRVPGGRHPAGWTCDVLPQLYEFDNCAAGLTEDQPGATIWGADEATWFANQPAAYRNEFLGTAWNWIWQNAPRGYLQMPGRRPARIPVLAPRTYFYALNTRSSSCLSGSSQEEAVKALWSDPRYRDNSARPAPSSPAPSPAPSDSPPRPRSLQELRRLYEEYGMPPEERASWQ